MSSEHQGPSPEEMGLKPEDIQTKKDLNPNDLKAAEAEWNEWVGDNVGQPELGAETTQSEWQQDPNNVNLWVGEVQTFPKWAVEDMNRRGQEYIPTHSVIAKELNTNGENYKIGFWIGGHPQPMFYSDIGQQGFNFSSLEEAQHFEENRSIKYAQTKNRKEWQAWLGEQKHGS